MPHPPSRVRQPLVLALAAAMLVACPSSSPSATTPRAAASIGSSEPARPAPRASTEAGAPPSSAAPNDDRPAAPRSTTVDAAEAPRAVDAKPAPETGTGLDGFIGRNRGRLRACYAKALREDPDAGGTLHVCWEQRPSGVPVARCTGLVPESLDECVCNELSKAELSPADRAELVTRSPCKPTP